MTTTPAPIATDTPDPAVSPWRAVLTWRDGQVTTWDEFAATPASPADVRIEIVRGSAAPADRDGVQRMPSTYNPADFLIEFDGERYETVGEVETLWGQVQAMAAGLNAAAPDGEDLDDEAVHGWFGLSYSNYAVLHRTLLQSMPPEWQRRFVACLNDLDEAYAHIEHANSYDVQAGEWKYAGECDDAELARAGAELFYDDPTSDDEGDAPVEREPRYSWRDDEHGPHDYIFVPGKEPVPHYQRGRTRIEPRIAIEDEPSVSRWIDSLCDEPCSRCHGRVHIGDRVAILATVPVQVACKDCIE